MRKLGQEEMIGFAMIIILVAVILLIFLGFALRTPSRNIQSFEIESFLGAMLQYTTDCETYLGQRTLGNVIADCEREVKCLNEEESCEVRDRVIDEILRNSWKVGENFPVKGYQLRIVVYGESEATGDFKDGILKGSTRGAYQNIPKTDMSIDVYFDVYY